MIIGNGLIASSFHPHFENNADVIIFASGVSNSRETNPAAFQREERLLMNALASKKYLVYFSTCSLSDPELQQSPYVMHKIKIEELVRSSKGYAIFRLTQVVGKTSNPHTLTNYLYQHITSDTPFQIWRHAKRNLIDVDDVVSIATYLIQSPRMSRITENIACPFSIGIDELVRIFEHVLRKKAVYTLKDAGGAYAIDTRLATAAAKNISIDFNENYTEKLLRKYYVS